MQVTQATILPAAKPKTIFDINCDDHAPSMAIILFIHALHLQSLVSSKKHGWQFEKEISIKSNRQELNFLKSYFIIIQILQLIRSMFGEHHSTEVRNTN
jgi:hypothetical protein